MSTSDKINKKRARLKGRASFGEKSKPGMALIPEEIMNSPAYIRLPIPGRHLLTEVSTQFRPGGHGNNGSLCLAYEAIFESRGWKRSQFYKLVRLLAKSGFIVITRKGGNRLATYCALAWRDINPPMEKVGGYDPHVIVGTRPSKPWIKSVADHPTLAKKFSGNGDDGAAKNRGGATQPVKFETCYGVARSRLDEAANVLPESTLEAIEPLETGCHTTHYKNLCHGQGDFSQHDSVDSFAEGDGGLEGSVAAQAERIAKAKAECPVFAPVSNVIPLSVVWSRPTSVPTELPKNPTPVSAELEAVTTEFRELLIVGGITPAVAEKRIGEIHSTHGETAAMQFMREFVASKGEKIREERKAARTSGAIAASVRWFKPAQLAA